MTAGGLDIRSAQSAIEGFSDTREDLDFLFHDIFSAQHSARIAALNRRINECIEAARLLKIEYENVASAIFHGDKTLGDIEQDLSARDAAKNAEIEALRQEHQNLRQRVADRYRNEYEPRSDTYHNERGHYDPKTADAQGFSRDYDPYSARRAEAELRKAQFDITEIEQKIAFRNEIIRNPIRPEHTRPAATELRALKLELQHKQQEALRLSNIWENADTAELNKDARAEWRNAKDEAERIQELSKSGELTEENQVALENAAARAKRAEEKIEARAAKQKAEVAKKARRDTDLTDIDRLAVQQDQAHEANKWSCNPSRAVIVGGLVTVAAGALLFMFVPGSPLNVSGNKKSPHHSGDSTADPQDAFAASGDRIQNFHENTQDISSRDAWIGGASTGYAVNNAGIGNLAEHIAATNQAVDGIVQTQAEQVTTGRRTVADAFDGLQLAMPASDSLYLSGPAGPAMSYSFQLAATSSAVSTGIDTTQKMHDNSCNHAARLTELAQQYDAALQQIHSGGSLNSPQTAA